MTVQLRHPLPLLSSLRGGGSKAVKVVAPFFYNQLEVRLDGIVHRREGSLHQGHSETVEVESDGQDLEDMAVVVVCTQADNQIANKGLEEEADNALGLELMNDGLVVAVVRDPLQN